ncbi:PREDICTED: uncharacterized protein LOC105460675, partial [Wasmannia auropunctata]|uniref:uncharacterized protein LOC105460675 n=1 Tax=Wasmannia auropunctata TaxID=64793 RepID=UPI0005ED7872
MACYFGWLVFDIRATFYAILIDNYVKSNKLYITMTIIWISHNISKFLLFNYVCETISTKASATANLLNRLLYSNYDVEIRETISQYSLQIIHMPLRFYGIGLFQFGFQFLYKFVLSIATVLVIVIQAREN